MGISCCPLVHVAPKLDRKRLSKVVTVRSQSSYGVPPAYLVDELSNISKPAKCSRGRLEGKGLKRMTAEIPVRRTCRNPHEFPHSMPHRRRVLVSFDGNVFSLDITCVVRFTSSSIYYGFSSIFVRERVGSDTSSRCLAQHRGPFSSRSTTRSKGEKRREKEHHPQVRALAEDKREERIQRCRDNHRTRNRRTVECLSVCGP